MIKILTGYSDLGGSTIAHINLCNAFNEYGIDCELYGPNNFILDKCRSKLLKEVKIEKCDKIIYHYLRLNRDNIQNKIIYSCHENVTFDNLQAHNFKPYDIVHFVSEKQKILQNVNVNAFVLPNILDDLKVHVKPKTPVAAVIGSIDRNKQTLISIERAYKKGFNEVKLFGKITDIGYFAEIKKYCEANCIKIDCEIELDKQKMYDQITDVFHSAIVETWGYIQGECELTGTTYHPLHPNNFWKMEKGDIINEWIQQLI